MRTYRRAAILFAVILGLVAAAGVTARGAHQAVHVGCPPHFSQWSVRGSLIDGAIAAARVVVIDNDTETNQGRVTRRTPQNYYLRQVVFLGGAQGVLFERAAARCSSKVAAASWALVFQDAESPVATYEDVRFAIRMANGWWVY